MEKSHKKVVQAEWTIQNAKEYMNVHGLNTECVDAVLCRAKKCQLLQLIQDDPDRFSVEVQEAIGRQ